MATVGGGSVGQSMEGSTSNKFVDSEESGLKNAQESGSSAKSVFLRRYEHLTCTIAMIPLLKQWFAQYMHCHAGAALHRQSLGDNRTFNFLFCAKIVPLCLLLHGQIHRCERCRILAILPLKKFNKSRLSEAISRKNIFVSLWVSHQVSLQCLAHTYEEANRLWWWSWISQEGLKMG